MARQRVVIAAARLALDRAARGIALPGRAIGADQRAQILPHRFELFGRRRDRLFLLAVGERDIAIPRHPQRTRRIEGTPGGHRRKQRKLLVKGALLALGRRAARLVVGHIGPSRRHDVDPVGPARQHDTRLPDGDFALRLDDHGRAAHGAIMRNDARRGPHDPREPEAARRGPGHLFGQHLARKRNEARLGHRLRLRRDPGAQEPLDDPVQRRPAAQRVGLGAQGIERLQPQHMAGIDRIGIADQRRDLGDRQTPGPRPDRRAGRGARRARRRRRRRLECRGHGKPPVPARAHRVQRRHAALPGHPAQKIHEPVQPARRHGLRLGVAHRARQHDLGRRRGQHEIMRSKADPPLGRHEAHGHPHRPVQPGIGRGQRRPDPVIEAPEHDQIRSFGPRLAGAADHNARMRCDGLAHRFAREHVGEQPRMLLGRHRPRGVGFGPEPVEQRRGREARRTIPQRQGRPVRPRGQRLAQRPVRRHMVPERQRPPSHPLTGNPHPRRIKDPAQPVGPCRGTLGRHLPLGNKRRHRRPDCRPLRKDGPAAPQPRLERARPRQMLAPPRPRMDQRMAQQHQQLERARPGAAPVRRMAQEPPGRGLVQRFAGAVVGHDPPAVERGRHLTRQRAVRCHERGAEAARHCLAQRKRDRAGLGARRRRLDQRHRPRRRPRVAEAGCLGQPPIRHRRRPQRHRDQPVARLIGRRRASPATDRLVPCPDPVEQAPIARLRMILGADPVIERGPCLGRHAEIEARQDHGTRPEPRDRRHQKRGAPARARRSRDDHRRVRWLRQPARDQPEHRRALPGAGLGRAAGMLERPHDPQKRLRARPMRRMARDIEPRECLGRHPLARHFIHERRQRRREIQGCRLRREVGRAIEQPLDQARQFERAPQRACRRRQVGQQRVGADLGHEADPRQKPRPRCRHRGKDPLPHQRGIDMDAHARHRLGRRCRHARAQPRRDLGREIDAGRQPEEAAPLSHRRPLRRAWPRLRRSRPGGRHRTTRPGAGSQRRGPRRSARPRPAPSAAAPRAVPRAPRHP